MSEDDLATSSVTGAVEDTPLAASDTSWRGPAVAPSRAAEDRASATRDDAALPTSDAEPSAPGAVPGSLPERGRFYAPGRGARVERPEPLERAAPPAPQSIAPVAASPSPRRAERPERGARVERVERAERPHATREPREPHEPHEPVDADSEQEYTGPRGDVRGPVGELIDSLHEVFARDRAMASQGGVTRCGVCYLHFPASELIYREADGFYVCESCAHALGAVRVPMVRRQQRQ